MSGRWNQGSFTFIIAMFLASAVHAQQWVAQPINPPNVPGLWSIAMFDTGRGIAVGGAAVPTNLSGIVRKTTGSVTWQKVDIANFSPALSSSFPFWSGACARKGTGTAWVCGSNAKIYKTVDYGANWIEKTSGISVSQSFFDIYFKSATEGMVVGQSGVAYYTTNGGDTWTVQSTGTGNPLYAVHCAGAIWYISGGNNTVLKFSPPSTWTDISSNLPGGSSFSLIEGLQFLDDQVGTLSGYNSAGPTNVYRTTNGGNSWSPFPAEPPLNGSANFYSSVFFFNQTVGWVANAFDPVGYTQDGGASWQTFTPQGGGAGAITRLDFNNFQNGWASGGAVGGGPIPLGFILKYTGPPPSPDISLSAVSVDFGTLTCATSKDTTYTITNRGIADLIIPINGIKFSRPDFSYVGPALPLTLQPGQIQPVTIRWTPAPSSFGPLTNDTMTIQSNDPAYPQWKVGLNGIKNYGSGTAIPSGLTFPPVCGTLYSELELTISPFGNTNPTFTGFNHETGDSVVTVVSPPVGTVLTGPTVFKFRYSPRKLGNASGMYRLMLGNPSCPEGVLIPFTATWRKNHLVANPTTIDFGDVCSGSTRDKTFLLTSINSNTIASVDARELVTGTDLFPNVYSGPFGPIRPDSSMSYTVRFAPSVNDTGVISATYRLLVGPCPDTVEYTVRGRAVKPALVTVPAALIRLGPITVGQTAQQIVTFSNSSTTVMRIKSITVVPSTASLSLVSGPTLPASLAPGQGSSVTVRYTPTRIESIAASVCIVWDDPCVDSTCVPLSAQGTESPQITTRTSMDLGTQACRPPRIDSVAVKNTGRGTLALLGFTIDGPQKEHFRVLRPGPATLVNPGDSVYVVIEYSSPLEQTSDATLTIEHNDATAGNKSVIALTGRRTVTEIGIEGDTSTVFTACIRNSVKRVITLRNPGTRTLTVTALSLSGAGVVYSITSPSLPATLQPAGSISVTIDYHPVAAGFSAMQLLIVATPCSDTIRVPFTGVATNSPLSFTPAPVNFGTINIGASPTRNVQITNAGALDIEITELFFDAPHPAVSLVSPPALPHLLKPGQSLQVTVKYNPLTAGSLFTSLCAGTSLPCKDTLRAAILGLARADGIGFDADSLVYKLDPCAKTGLCDTVILLNNSARQVTVSAISVDPSSAFTLGTAVGLPLTLNTGQSQPLIFCTDAGFTGRKTGTVHVISNDPNVPDLTLPLIALRDSVAITARMPLIDYGVVPRCATSVTRTIEYDNTGTVDDTLDIIEQLSAPFSVAAILPLTISAGGTQSIDITCAPTRAGLYLDTLRVRSRRCGTELHVVVKALYELENARVTPSPLSFTNVVVGGSATASLTVRNLNLASARVAAIRISPSGTFSASPSLPHVLTVGDSVEIPVRFAPSVAGTATATACIIFDAPCADTLCVQLTGSTGDGLLFTQNPLIFGTQAQCEEQILSDTLVNTTSAGFTLSGASITGAGSSAYSLVNPIVPGETVGQGARRVFTIRFAPVSVPDGNTQAVLTVTTSDATIPRVDLTLGGTRVTQSMPAPRAVPFGSIPTGTPTQRSVWIPNRGSAPFTISGTNLPAGITITPPPPVAIQPGDSIQFTITFTPQSSGPQVLSAWMRVTTPCEDSLRLDITAVAGGSITASARALGAVPNCIDTVVRIVIRNSFAQDGMLETVSITGVDAARFTRITPSSLPRLVPAGDSIIVEFRFSPDAAGDRVYSATCELSVTGLPAPSSLQALMSIDAREPVPTLVSSIDFGTISINTTSTSRRAVLQNLLPFPIRLAAVRSANTAYVLGSPSLILPATLQPRDTVSIPVTFTPPSAQVFDGPFLLFDTDSPCTGNGNGMLTGRGIDDVIAATLSIPVVEGTVDQRVLVPIMLNTDVGSANITSWQGAIRYNSSMLYPERVVLQGTKSTGATVTGDITAQGTFLITANGPALSSGAGVLAYVEFLVLIGDDVTSTLSLSPSFDFTSGRARVQSRQDGVFHLLGYCDADRSRMITDNWNLTLHQNAPNPFNPSTLIKYTLVQDAFVELTVTDAMGRPVQRLVSEHQKAGTYQLRFDAADKPSGLYIATLRSGSSATSIKMVLTR